MGTIQPQSLEGTKEHIEKKIQIALSETLYLAIPLRLGGAT